tara:strand:- start:143117 stop:144487 length:1371 start_codon:yes stop_codon:yes gene_type:complete
MLKFKELIKIETVEIKNPMQETTGDLSFYTDTRTHNGEQVFIAIEGANFKPLSFINKVKAQIIICEDNEYNREIINDNKDRTFIIVKSVINSLREVANLISKKFQANGGVLIAVSGSNGKTTTKEMLFHILSESGENVVCTQKNNNNHIGVPITLFQINADTKYCITELGSNHPGEIKYLVDMVEPSCGICTNIGETHLEFFDNVENVFKEEGYLLKYLAENNKTLFVNADDDFLEVYKSAESALSFGFSKDVDYSFDLDANSFKLIIDGETLDYTNQNITGKHNKLNLLVAAAICHNLKIPNDKVASAIASFKPTRNRSEWIELDGRKIFLDAYNANPSSMKAALLAFKEKCIEMNLKKDEFAIILGDMNELGKDAARYHEELGKFCSQNGFLNMYFVGNFAHSYNKGCNYIGTEFLTTDQLKKKMQDIVTLHKAMFIKGSRSLQLESTVDITLC